MDKYFTPDIEDIRVGYECEIQTSWSWIKGKWPEILNEDTHVGLFSKGNLIEDTKNASLRVPYLTKEQIEAEGWKHNGHLLLMDVTENNSLGDENLYGFDKNGFHLVFHLEKHKMTITKEKEDSFHSDDIRFKGECKDINTFRYICKLLKIN